MTRNEQILSEVQKRFSSNDTHLVSKISTFIDGAKWADEYPKKGMVSLEKVEEWLYKNFYESYNLNDYGKYDLDEPYITSSFNTINEMFDDLRKTMEE